MRPCKLCGLDLDLVGKSHRCVPRVSRTAAANTDDGARSAANVAANAPASYARWRIRDVEKRRAYMRRYMAERRRMSL
jgi:hypothetical protein